MSWRTVCGLLMVGWIILFGVSPARAARLAENVDPFERKPGEFVAAIIMLPRTHQILYAYQPDQIHPAASLTKLPNAMAFVKRHPAWSRIVPLSAEDEVGGGRLRVKSGARLTIQDVFYSSVTASANNAAMALMRLSGLTQKQFFAQMNKEAAALGATHSHFVDASGIDPANVTTARDMALIADRAFQNPMIRRAATTAQYRFLIRNTHELKVIHNTNPLLTQDSEVWVVGGKTGYLEESKYNFVTQLRPMTRDGRPVNGKDLIVVVLGAPDKEAQFTTAKRLAQWAWDQHEF